MPDDTQIIEPQATPGLAPTAPALDQGAVIIEERARRMGWVPREQWRGDGGAQWVDAGTFVATAEASYPVLKERYDKLDQRAAATERELKETRTALEALNGQLAEQRAVMDEFRTFASKGEERAYNRARREIEAKMASAVASADTGAFVAAQAEMRELEETKPSPAPAPRPAPAPVAAPAPAPEPAPAVPPAPAPAPAPQIPAEIAAWQDRNPWFVAGSRTFSPMLQGAAIEEEARLTRDEPGLSLAQRLEKVTENLRKAFPARFGITENPARQQPAPVGAPRQGDSPAAKKERGYDDLPAADKAACDRFCRTIPNFTKEEFLSQYNWDE